MLIWDLLVKIQMVTITLVQIAQPILKLHTLLLMILVGILIVELQNHIVGDGEGLLQQFVYNGNNKLLVGNGQGLDNNSVGVLLRK